MEELPKIKGRKARKQKRQEILQNLECRPKFYHLRDIDKRPIVTVCSLFYNDQKFMGISVCSRKDEPRKSTGRKIALDRAMAAAMSYIPILPVQRHEAKIVIEDIVPDSSIAIELLDTVQEGFKAICNME